jgi:hypothetical protein
MEESFKCGVEGCKERATIFYKNVGLCKTHGEDWINVEGYVSKYHKKREEEWRKKQRQIQTRGKYSHVPNVGITKQDTHTHSEHIGCTSQEQHSRLNVNRAVTK